MNSCEEPVLRSSDSALILPAPPHMQLRKTALVAFEWLRRHGGALMKRPSSRRLRLVETVTLGEKRFISIVQVDGEQFLLGASASALVVLAKLEGGQPLQQGSGESSFADSYSRASQRQRDALPMCSKEHVQ